MSERTINEIIIPQVTEHLIRIHWDGTGCGTNDNSGCSHCFGPSPMIAEEVVIEVINQVKVALANMVKTGIEAQLIHEKRLHDGPIWKAAIDRCIELVQKSDAVSL